MVMEYILFLGLLGIGLLVFTFHELGEKTKNVSLTEYSKLESPIERCLYHGLVMNGYHVRTQVTCGPYRIDLVIGRLAIERNGKTYHSSATKKDTYSRKQGCKVMWTKGISIVNRMPQVLKRVKISLN